MADRPADGLRRRAVLGPGGPAMAARQAADADRRGRVVPGVRPLGVRTAAARLQSAAAPGPGGGRAGHAGAAVGRCRVRGFHPRPASTDLAPLDARGPAGLRGRPPRPGGLPGARTRRRPCRGRLAAWRWRPLPAAGRPRGSRAVADGARLPLLPRAGGPARFAGRLAAGPGGPRSGRWQADDPGLRDAAGPAGRQAGQCHEPHSCGPRAGLARRAPTRVRGRVRVRGARRRPPGTATAALPSSGRSNITSACWRSAPDRSGGIIVPRRPASGCVVRPMPPVTWPSAWCAGRGMSRSSSSSPAASSRSKSIRKPWASAIGPWNGRPAMPNFTGPAPTCGRSRGRPAA